MISRLVIMGVFILIITSLPNVFASDQVVVLDTKSGELVIEFFPSDAPNTVENFIKLVENKFYDRTIFHRIIKDFMIQGGDPLTKPGAYQSPDVWGTGDAGYTIPAEFNDIKHNRGIVSMARSNDPDSASSQFFIVHKDSNLLDGEYTIFGRLVTEKSFETLDKIASLETFQDVALEWGRAEILKAEIKDHSEVPDLLELGDPERFNFDPKNGGQVYSNSLLGFSFISPLGWIIQEPEKTEPFVPDVVIIGPSVGGFNTVISILVEDSEGRTLDERIIEKQNNIQTAIKTGEIEILGDLVTTVNGYRAHIFDSVEQYSSQNTIILIQFREVTIEVNNKFYTLTYVSQQKDFESFLPRFNSVLETLEFDSVPNDGGCLIATAAFDSELSNQVQSLRELRDNIIVNTELGSSFLTTFNVIYYSFSPQIADLERENLLFKNIVKTVITPLITTLSILNYVDVDSEQEVLGYGLGIILLNIGIYFVAPAFIIMKLKKL